MSLTVTNDGPVRVVTLDRPDVRNAVDGEHAQALYDAFTQFDLDDSASVAVLHGAGGVFCAGADLGAVSRGEMPLPGTPDSDDRGPMGPTRLQLSKPVIAAVDGYAVAGGLELALWCDLRVADPGATFGVFCRRWGVPLIDGGTVRLPRLVGFGVAMDLILTGRAVTADEAVHIGLATRVSRPGAALTEAVALAHELAALPQLCLRGDRLSAYDSIGLSHDEAMNAEWSRGLVSLQEAAAGAARFAAGEGRHGSPS
ncbi:MAG: enoyl-CoA hydratase [Actinomycetota bacterium]|jgi:enoyl-CoA hydratase|nr:enoyl-CoA hydratase [Actinomycetota bacterium]